METYKKDFIEFCLAHDILRFGSFKLKSGRQSPYFFNAGLFNTGESLATLGGYYAKTIHQAKLKFDVMFGPAYKGIPLVSATAIAIASMYDEATPFAFNRKEEKDHGEGGNLVGSPLKNTRVLILDDVITAGTAFYESKKLIESQQACVAGIVIALDRQEKGLDTEKSALQEIQSKEKIPVISLVTLDNLITYLQEDADFLSSDILKNMLLYRETYGA
ncbi:MAG: orotate phosphoribosyltransferase [Burkholderiaceae bacterium]|nr:orotate phosphoribosyltransferase [Burkholderiaceae bacterium]